MIELDATGTDEPTVRQPVPFHLEADRNTVLLSPQGTWPPGASLRLKVNLSTITGNVMDDRIYAGVVRKGAMLKVTAISADGREVPQEIAKSIADLSQQILANQSVALSAPTQYPDRWRFLRWQSPLTTLPDGADISWTPTCENLVQDVPVQAVLERTDTFKLAVQVDGGGVVVVFDNLHNPVMTIDAADTILICDAFPACSLAVLPDSGMDFLSWEASNMSFNGSTAALAIVNGVNQLSTTSPNSRGNVTTVVNPKFGPVQQGAEEYRLTGQILDVDENEGWDATEAVVFTTENIFESTGPEERTMCLQAGRCWEIIGYYDSYSGDFVMYDQPLEQTCVTARLRSPKNVVSFLVQRKYIQLRVEKVLTASDDPNDVIKNGVLGPGTRIRVQRRDVKNAKTVWKTLNEATCTDGTLTFSPYTLQCGDVVRLTPFESQVGGQVWLAFAERDRYVLPHLENAKAAEQFHYMVIEEDVANFQATYCDLRPSEYTQIRVRGAFQQKFGIEAIGLVVRTLKNGDRATARFEERWYDPLTYRQLASDEPKGGRQIEYVPRRGTLVKIRFTMPIDQRTVMAGGIGIDSYDNTLYSKPNTKDLEFITASQDGNVWFEGKAGESPRTVVLSIMKPNTSPVLQALHGGTFELHCTTALKSLSGAALPFNSIFLLQNIELPAYMLALHEVEFKYDGDADFIFENEGEIYHAMLGGDLGVDKALATDQAFRRVPDCSEQQGVVPGDCTLPHSDKDGPQGYGDMLLWIQPFWMDRQDIAWWYASTYDEDCKDENDCFVNNVQDFLDLTSNMAAEYGGGTDSERIRFITDIIQLGVSFVKALMTPDEQDRHLGYGNFIGYGGNLWGGRRTTEFWEVGDDNTTYRLKPMLLVTRDVIR
jgi:hypothetical protein